MTGAASLTLDIGELVGSFPSFRVALVAAADLRIAPARSAALSRFIEETERAVAAGIADTALADLPQIRCWREAYRSFGVKKTSYRASVERLLKSVQRGGGLPRVNALVDTYNAISVLYRLPVGADDLDRVTPPLAFRFARGSDSFIALGDAGRSLDPPKPGEVVYADAEKCLCRRWNWYQDDRSATSATTRHAVLTIQSLEPDSSARLPSAAEQLSALLTEHCGARTRWAIADRDHPRVSVVFDRGPSPLPSGETAGRPR